MPPEAFRRLARVIIRAIHQQYGQRFRYRVRFAGGDQWQFANHTLSIRLPGDKSFIFTTVEKSPESMHYSHGYINTLWKTQLTVAYADPQCVSQLVDRFVADMRQRANVLAARKNAPLVRPGQMPE